MTDRQINGVDYLTGERGVPLSELVVLEETERAEPSRLFPSLPDGYPTFAAAFVTKYGVAERSQAPVVVSETSESIIRSFWDQTDGEINKVDPRKARRAW